ncbi:MAG TPA: hypothetical protein VFN75_12210 [Pseudonocardiaceae bacterium]|nr:hypothetical protein [Pseudonocardiaceae bacterium]
MSEQQAGAARPPYPREPNVHSGGEQDPGGDRDLPPYEDRQKTGPGEDKDKLLQERGGVPGHEAGPREVSDAERGGVSDTDMTPSGPHGVGQSMSTSGQDLAPGSKQARHEDQLNTGVSDEGQITGPPTHSGDQGG